MSSSGFGVLVLALLGIGGVVAWGALLAEFDDSGAGGSAASWNLIVVVGSLLLCLMPAIGWIIWYTAQKKSEIRRRSGLRLARLERIVRHPNAKARLPHRVAEHALTAATHIDKALRRFARTLPPGHVIFCRTPSAARLRIAAATDVPFEPIDLYKDQEQLAWLQYLGDPATRAAIDAGGFDPTAPLDPAADASAGPDAESAAPRSLSRRAIGIPVGVVGCILGLLIFLAPWAFVIFLIVQAVRQPSPVNVGLALLPFGLAIAGIVANPFRSRSFFLIPGGVAVRTTGLAGRNATVQRFTPADASIVANTVTSAVWLVPADGGKPIALGAELSEGNPLLIAWLSTAPTPSQAQLELLLDPKG